MGKAKVTPERKRKCSLCKKWGHNKRTCGKYVKKTPPHLTHAKETALPSHPQPAQIPPTAFPEHAGGVSNSEMYTIENVEVLWEIQQSDKETEVDSLKKLVQTLTGKNLISEEVWTQFLTPFSDETKIALVQSFRIGMDTSHTPLLPPPNVKKGNSFNIPPELYAAFHNTTNLSLQAELALGKNLPPWLADKFINETLTTPLSKCSGLLWELTKNSTLTGEQLERIETSLSLDETDVNDNLKKPEEIIKFIKVNIATHTHITPSLIEKYKQYLYNPRMLPVYCVLVRNTQLSPQFLTEEYYKGVKMVQKQKGGRVALHSHQRAVGDFYVKVNNKPLSDLFDNPHLPEPLVLDYIRRCEAINFFTSQLMEHPSLTPSTLHMEYFKTRKKISDENNPNFAHGTVQKKRAPYLIQKVLGIVQNPNTPPAVYTHYHQHPLEGNYNKDVLEKIMVKVKEAINYQ